MKKREEKGEYKEIDLLQILKTLWKKIWVILLTAAVFGGITFAVTKIFITPHYKSTVLMYVNNQTTNDKEYISQSDIVASHSLIGTCKVILSSRTTLDEVIRQADLPYTAGQLSSMLASSAVNSTEVFQVTVESTDPKEAALIANTIGEILPKRVASIVAGSSVRLIDYAKESRSPSSPNVKQNTLLGTVIGIIVSIIVIVVIKLRDDKISGPDYLTQRYDIPVLAVIPDLASGQENSEHCPKNSNNTAGQEGKRP